MLVWSEQWKLVNDISLSFQKKEKVFIKVNKSMERDKLFLNPNKYSAFSKNDFKFFVLWTCFTYNTNSIGTFKKLNSYNKENINYINQQKDKMVYYCNSLEDDKKLMSLCLLDYNIIKQFYNQDKISIAGLWWFLKNNKPKTRTQIKLFNNTKLFMSYFKERTC